MKYKEFVAWCNERACDGCWGLNIAMFCISIMEEVNTEHIWKREKKWQELNELYSIVKCIVEPVNERIEDVYQ